MAVYVYEWAEDDKLVMGYVDKRHKIPKEAQKVGRSDLNGAVLQMMVRETRLKATGYMRTSGADDYQVWEKRRPNTEGETE